MSAPSKAFGVVHREVADGSRDNICYVDAHLRIEYCNQAWDEFALRNGGPFAVGAHVVGRHYFDFVPQELRRFFQTVFDSCALDGQPFAFDYECSSASAFRLFRMTVYPQQNGFALVHSLRIERPHDRQVSEPGPEYLGPLATITLCVHCRRSRRETDLTRWDWVPAHLKIQSARINDSVCPSCRSYFYDLVAKPASASALLKRRS